MTRMRPIPTRVVMTTVFAAVAAIACSDPPPSKYPVKQVFVEDTKLGPRDVFEVRVFRQPELTGGRNRSG